MQPVSAWHFLPDDGKMRWGKWRPVRPGVTYVTRKPLVLCTSGLHASIRAIDALQYAPGALVCRVECGGEIIHGDDKLACSRRRVVWMADATRTLHEFALWCAERALALVTPDPRSLEVLRVKRLWLDGQATNTELTAARDAALAAARDARDAARDAAWAAAWAAARDTAWDTAWDAARDAARDAQNDELTRRLEALRVSGLANKGAIPLDPIGGEA